MRTTANTSPQSRASAENGTEDGEAHARDAFAHIIAKRLPEARAAYDRATAAGVSARTLVYLEPLMLLAEKRPRQARRAFTRHARTLGPNAPADLGDTAAQIGAPILALRLGKGSLPTRLKRSLQALTRRIPNVICCR
jgi:hypothetical protein